MNAPSAVTPDRARRYLLRTLSDDESERLEREYIASPDALDEVTAAEDALIEDYLDAALPADDRQRFEQAYLSSDLRRLRVDGIRRLRRAAGAGRRAAPPGKGSPAVWRRYMPFAAAAALVVAVLVTVWRVADQRRAPVVSPATAQQSPAPAAPSRGPAAVPSIVAISLSPIATRSATASPPLVIPAGMDAVAISLVVDAAPLSATRVELTTVDGRSVWRGAAAAAPDRGAVTLQLPAALLPPDDYILTLFGRRGSAVEAEEQRYFLRVRAR